MIEDRWQDECSRAVIQVLNLVASSVRPGCM